MSEGHDFGDMGQLIDGWGSMEKRAARLERENSALREYLRLVCYIANDYHELSHDKAKWQRDDWKRRCRELIERTSSVDEIWEERDAE